MQPVSLVQPSERGRAGEVLGLAFRNDPLWSAILPDEDTRHARTTRMFTDLVRLATAARGQPVTIGLESVGIWLPPGRRLGFWPMVRSRFATVRSTLALPKGDRARMMAVLGQLDDRRTALMQQPHWYLLALGTHPDSAGRGFGTRLVHFGTDWADRTSQLCYLETESEGNVHYYEGLGFRVVEELTAASVGVPMWLMLREPVAAESTRRDMR